VARSSTTLASVFIAWAGVVEIALMSLWVFANIPTLTLTDLVLAVLIMTVRGIGHWGLKLASLLLWWIRR
jgi:hypothetical protein